MSKKKILWMGEASYLNSGYARYTSEILKRLYSTGKYEIAEFACYGHYADNRRENIHWKFYANLPDTSSDDDKYNSDIINQFGKWRFEEVCVNFKPDIVTAISDPWMYNYIHHSPFRKFFKFILMPTVDSIPQSEENIAGYADADKLLTYTEFGEKYLKDNRLSVYGVPSPSVDYNIFKPVEDKKQHRHNSGVMTDINIIGTIMRNQGRKLYPDLIESFRQFLDKYPDLAINTYLYIHCAFPDRGWDIPRLIRDNGISHRTLFTYLCSSCGTAFPSFWHDALQPCVKCGKLSARLPGVQAGVTAKQLSSIINLFDVYVQYSNSEGFGMPMLEAAACGVPIMAVNYSGMESVLQNIGGFPIKVQRYISNSDTHVKWALPDNDDFIAKLVKYLRMTPGDKQFLSEKTVLKCQQRYNYDKSAAIWEKVIDDCDCLNNKSWDCQPDIYEPQLNKIPKTSTVEQFVSLCFIYILNRPEWISSYYAAKLIRDLNYGRKIVFGTRSTSEQSIFSDIGKNIPCTRESVVAELMELRKFMTYWEGKRVGRLRDSIPQYILEA